MGFTSIKANFNGSGGSGEAISTQAFVAVLRIGGFGKVTLRRR